MGCGRCSLTICWCLLHARGGVSSTGDGYWLNTVSSPRPWRCFPVVIRERNAFIVFSTPVEVFLREARRTLAQRGLLHARGGVSEPGVAIEYSLESSPRPWRCFFLEQYPEADDEVFSTPVEVFPPERVVFTAEDCLLHARGGVSHSIRIRMWYETSSPRPWRCFPSIRIWAVWIWVFSTPVEVFLLIFTVGNAICGLLHARGGVSAQLSKAAGHLRSSPRPWRCFRLKRWSRYPHRVFSTPMEVFPV